MSILISISAIIPIVAVIICILCFKRNAVFSSIVGLATAGIIVIAIDSYRISVSQLLGVLQSALILSLSAVLVIIPGLYLNGVIRGQGYINKITNWFESISIVPEKKALILLLGFLPAVESLTGFGVSMFLSVPILFKLFPSKKALKLALLGMNIMPWGTLGLATVIGSSLIQVYPTKLGTLTSLTSFLVFPYIGLVSLYVIGGLKALLKYMSTALLLGFSLSGLLFINNYYIYTETAGVIAGTVTGLLGFYLSFSKKNQIKSIWKNKLLKIFLPYILILILISVTRLIQPLNYFITNAIVLKSHNVKFSVLSSPGIVLLVVAIILQQKQPITVSYLQVLQKAKNACLSITSFLILSQLMLQSGMIKNLAVTLSQHTQQAILLMLSPFMGMISGFTTGSNVGGNALLIGVQNRIGQEWNQGTLFAAVNNSAAGHTVFSSIPIIILVLTIVKDENIFSHFQANESQLLKFTLKVSIGIYIAILLSFYAIFHINGESILF